MFPSMSLQTNPLHSIPFYTEPNCSLLMHEDSLQEEIAANYIWLKPLVRQWPTSVPGGMVLTDIFLHLANKKHNPSTYD